MPVIDARLPKPAFGDPCNRCGRCCEVWLCALATLVLYDRSSDIPGPCPALVRNADNTTSCGMVENPAKWRPMQTIAHGHRAMREAAATMICAGTCCDAHHSGEPPVPQAIKERAIRLASKRKLASKQARKLWDI